MRINVKNRSAERVASAAELRAHLRLDSLTPIDTDAELEQMVDAATEAAELHMHRWVLPTDLVVGYAAWVDPPWFLPGGTVQSFGSILYLTSSALEALVRTSPDPIEDTEYAELDAGDYVVTVTDDGYSLRIQERPSDSLARVDDAVRVIYQVGYADAAAVPVAIKVAVLELAGDLYENREASAMTQIYENPAVLRMLNRYRIHTETVQPN